ncbi:hypothetical protein B484DRAFT_425955 [Ochromonadaceae sp. CCMP2298]|nr:hypothetical protein B484DRAFT_425955 [Ochromonadaceae sp. CCMP2298]
MGASKSKPVEQSARAVLAKRNVGAFEAAQVQDVKPIDIGLKINLAYKPISYRAGPGDLDESMRKEMAKWPVIKSTTVNAQRLDMLAADAAGAKEGKAPAVAPKEELSANLIRIQEQRTVDAQEASNTRPKVTGRLTETQLISFYSKIRTDATYTSQMAAAEYGLTEELVDVLRGAAKFPITEENKESLELVLAR